MVGRAISVLFSFILVGLFFAFPVYGLYAILGLLGLAIGAITLHWIITGETEL